MWMQDVGAMEMLYKKWFSLQLTTEDSRDVEIGYKKWNLQGSQCDSQQDGLVGWLSGLLY